LDPVIATIAKYVEPNIPKTIYPMTTIRFLRSVKGRRVQCYREMHHWEVIYLIEVNKKWHNWIENLDGSTKGYLDLAYKVLGWLPTFLNSRILLYDFGVGKHWIWTLFSHAL
jgi:hypothetical protein